MKAAELIERAACARRAGRTDEARTLLNEVIGAQPNHPVALNSLGLIALGCGDASEAMGLFERAAAADPTAPSIWLNLAESQRQVGLADAELASLDRALAIDAYLLPALLRKAQALERLGRIGESAQIYRAILSARPGTDDLPEAIRAALDHGRELVRTESLQRAAAMAGPLAEVRALYADADFSRAQGYADHRAGVRQVYQPQPTGGHFPYLPAFEFFDRELFSWFGDLEAATAEIARELLSLWNDGDQGFAPYVAFDPTQPVNQWAELNHSQRWNAWFFHKDGKRQERNCARCPITAAVLDKLPLLDIPGKAPTSMFSILHPHTRIPPHTGTSNVRTTVHLPLIVPEGCGFRVGSETREWRIGEAWAFDDTIEHEAWNESDRPRAILIIDAWNPLLTEAERAIVRAIG
ncbi:aspartyl/asparaginyl beta-hydroxylase domain-containing protein [Tsuneonella troitsensis]|uniref:aspartyl/asparaginyl beta-hydroxylase domain-containing protein n=1 Tax=Tsuneonella troitsensis TaxID=292222 RepID=UPI00070AD7FB|nr:aspartyl/asparaginyl beta-hydroxylase domain-containing protein [Tsuneonella troitsensis]